MSDRKFLAVSYTERDEAKALGAKWDSTAKQWYVPDGVEESLFAKWSSKKRPAEGMLAPTFNKFFKPVPAFDFGRPLDTYIKIACYQMLVHLLGQSIAGSIFGEKTVPPTTLLVQGTKLAIESITEDPASPAAIVVKAGGRQFILYMHYVTLRNRLEYTKSGNISEDLYQVDLLRTLNQKIMDALELKVFVKDDKDQAVELQFSW